MGVKTEMTSGPATEAVTADRRDRFLDVALALFSEHGFVGTTTDMIVAEVGGSKATLYRYFPSKDALMAGLLDRLSESVGGEIAELTGSDEPLDEALTKIGRVTLVGVVSPMVATVLRLCLGEYGRFPELSRVVWEHGPAVTYANFRSFLEERERRGEVRVEDTQLAAEQFIAGLVGHLQFKVAMGMAEAPDEAEVERRVASAVATFLARYGVRH